MSPTSLTAASWILHVKGNLQNGHFTFQMSFNIKTKSKDCIPFVQEVSFLWNMRGALTHYQPSYYCTMQAFDYTHHASRTAPTTIFLSLTAVGFRPASPPFLAWIAVGLLLSQNNIFWRVVLLSFLAIFVYWWSSCGSVFPHQISQNQQNVSMFYWR